MNQECAFCPNYPANACCVCHAGMCSAHTVIRDGRAFCQHCAPLPIEEWLASPARAQLWAHQPDDALDDMLVLDEPAGPSWPPVDV